MNHEADYWRRQYVAQKKARDYTAELLRETADVLGLTYQAARNHELRERARDVLLTVETYLAKTTPDEEEIDRLRKLLAMSESGRYAEALFLVAETLLPVGSYQDDPLDLAARCKDAVNDLFGIVNHATGNGDDVHSDNA